MAFKVKDEHGWDWLVDKGDPADQACRLLDRTGFKSLVLPRITLITGSVPVSGEAYVRLATEALAGLQLVNSDGLPAKTRNALVNNAHRGVRLLECLEVLEEVA